MTGSLVQKLDVLRAIIRGCGSALVAYSGGVDSALVLAVAWQELGNRALGCIGDSPSYPRRELRDAVALAENLAVPYRVINTREYADENYAANPANRCYFCKSELYNRLRSIARDEGWNTILDGNHLDDVTDHVNGMSAARERGVRSPLLEASICKSEVRATARELGLPSWNKPAMACLSSRVPHGTPITPKLLNQIESAEDVLAELGFRQFRVRHHGELARIELPVEEFPQAMKFRERIVTSIQAAGYRHVCLDMAGFRSPSNAASVSTVPITIHSADQVVKT
jgi:uncharacterized protein